MALSAGFGLDFERCAPEVFAAVFEQLEREAEEQEAAAARARREALAAAARQQFGGS